MIERIDFTSCRRLLGKAYNGAKGKKIAVEYEDRQYMLKFPPSCTGDSAWGFYGKWQEKRNR